MLPQLAANERPGSASCEARPAPASRTTTSCAIHQVGEDRGVPFLAMPFLAGRVAGRPARPAKGRSVAEVLRIGREIAEGLAAATPAG